MISNKTTNSLGEKMNVSYKGVEYSEGDIIEFEYYGDKVKGVVTFGLYDDSEYYRDDQHLGFYIKLDERGFAGTLPDVIDEIDFNKSDLLL